MFIKDPERSGLLETTFNLSY